MALCAKAALRSGAGLVTIAVKKARLSAFGLFGTDREYGL